MRGWALLALTRAGVSDAALIFVLEELDTGIDAYVVTAAARALRSYPRPTAAFAPFVMRAITNIRYHDEPVSFDGYGEYGTGAPTDTSPVHELLATLDDLARIGLDILTIGQYLRPTLNHLPVRRYVPPEEFDSLGREARARGIRVVQSGPLVRSSYRAKESFEILDSFF